MKRTIKEYIKNQFMQQIKYHEKSTQTRLWVAQENKAKWTSTFNGCLYCNAMPKLRYSLLGNQHAIPLLEVVQTTSLLVVLIITLVPKAAEQPLTTARSAGEMKA